MTNAHNSLFEDYREESPSRKQKLLLILSALFICSLVLTNAIAGRLFVLFGQELSCGILAYPLTFIITDLISELYGRKRANMVVISGFIVSVLAVFIIMIATVLPIWEGSPVSQGSFVNVFGLMPGIVFGSMIAYLSAQFIDVFLFEFWRKITHGKHLWIRNNGSTIFSQAVDSFLVVSLAFGIWPLIDFQEHTQPLTWAAISAIIVGQYLFKIGVAVLDTPLVYLGVHYFKKYLYPDNALVSDYRDLS